MCVKESVAIRVSHFFYTSSISLKVCVSCCEPWSCGIYDNLYLFAHVAHPVLFVQDGAVQYVQLGTTSRWREHLGSIPRSGVAVDELLSRSIPFATTFSCIWSPSWKARSAPGYPQHPRPCTMTCVGSVWTIPVSAASLSYDSFHWLMKYSRLYWLALWGIRTCKTTSASLNRITRTRKESSAFSESADTLSEEEQWTRCTKMIQHSLREWGGLVVMLLPTLRKLILLSLDNEFEYILVFSLWFCNKV